MTGFDDRFGAAPAPSGPPAAAGPSGSAGSAGPMSQPYPSAMSQPYPSPGGQPQFGAAPVFGTPTQPGQPGQTWGTPTYAPSRSKTWGTPQIVSAVVIGIVALSALSFGWRYWENHRGIAAPATLGGLAQLHDPAVDQAMDTARTRIKEADKGHKAVIIAYGAGTGSDVAILVGVRGRLASIENDLVRGSVTGGTTQQVGHNTCAPIPGGFVCERTSAHLTEGVVSQSTKRTMAQVSAMLDEAWAKA